jgi:hypothetical protein
MRAAFLLSLGLAVSGASSPADQSVGDQYKDRASKAGRSADAQISLALWCEQHGLATERIEHLTKAILADPGNALARSLMGQAKDGDSWLKTDALAEKIAADAKRAASLAEYNARREKTPMTAHEQMLLAIWCDQNGLKPEAIAHYATVTRLNPRHEEAWRQLGCRKVGGRWLNDEQAKALERETSTQRVANREWGARLTSIKRKLKDRRQRADALAALDAIRDRRAVPAIWYHLVLLGGETEQRLAVNVLSRLDSQPAAQSLALVAAMSPIPDVRRIAAESVLWRDRREYLDTWISFIRKPLGYEVRPVGGPGSPGILLVEGAEYNVRRIYELPRLPDNLADFLTIDDNGNVQRAIMRQIFAGDAAPPNNPDVASAIANSIARPGAAVAGLSAAIDRSQSRQTPIAGNPPAILIDNRPLAERQVAQNQAAVAAAMAEPQRRLERDIAELEAINAANFHQTERILPFLEAASGEKFGHDPEAWIRWWTNELGYSYRSNPKPTIDQVIQAQTPFLTPVTPATTIVSTAATTSCFAAGTPVLTIGGARPIESIRIGDQVLTQEPQSGALSYQPVVANIHNPPDRTLRLGFGAEIIEATGIHRFWKAGSGWMMARDLQVGDPVRTTSGIARITSIEPGQAQPVFNLEVASGRSFFVGNIAALVHDYTLIETIDRPFDALQTAAAD